MKSMASLFLSQSYRDAWDDSIRALNRPNFVRWDFVILTASNEQQAEGFRAQLKQRADRGLLPESTRFAVLPDPDGRRVGSGGATLNVLKYVAEQTGGEFGKRRILVIHSGGDSKRVPQYSALGKLFSPVPHELPDGRSSTLFDEFMIAMSGMPARVREGMLVLSGDVLLLFNPLQIDFSGRGAAAISFKADVETGKNHGVYLMGEDGNVSEFLHKQSVERLREKGAVNARGCVDIDTGAVLFSPEMLSALYGLISENGRFSRERFDGLVNERTRLSLYGDFLYPLAEKSTMERFYLEQPEGEFCEELARAREVMWRTLRPFRMKLLRLSPARFVHFGTTREILRLMNSEVEEYASLGWSRQVNSSVSRPDTAAYGSVLDGRAVCGPGSYFEVSYVHAGATVGAGSVLSHIEIENETIPDGVILHGLKQKDGRFVARILGVEDNPKATPEDGGRFLGLPMTEFLENSGISADELWDGSNRSLWTAALYPACDDIRQAVTAALNLWQLSRGGGDLEAWRAAPRKSLCSGFNDADPDALIAWNLRMQELVRMDRIESVIRNGGTVEEAAAALNAASLTRIQSQWLENRLEKSGFGGKMRLNYFVGRALGGAAGEKYMDASFRALREGVLESTLSTLRENTECRITCDEHIVRLPLRVNWGGGWSDTPPICNERGGTVLNTAILLNGQRPVQVTLRRLDEKKIVFDSQDMNSHGEFTTIEPLQDCGDPYDPFALQKAALIACGVIPLHGSSLDTVLTRLGGGLFMSTEVTGVPKGSGLGTSSILAGACVRALFEFLGIPHTESDLYDYVLCMEQIMSTGGGWQDQVGGLSDGVKLITSRPGMRQHLQVQRVELDENVRSELRERFALIYTGQRRLARNLLRDVVGRYIGNVPEALDAIERVQRLAVLMRFELERGDVDAFARLLNEHWMLSRQLDSGSTNTCIDQIFCVVEDLIDGKMICGAGGGGFLQVILKKGVSREMLKNRLDEVFQDSGVDVWDCELI